MATITGLQSPNPYAQVALKAPVRERTVELTEDLGNHTVSPNHPYSPDWMQGDNAAAASEPTPTLYGAKGEPLKLPLTGTSAGER